MTGEPCLLGTNVEIPLGMMVPAPDVQPHEVPPNAEGVVQLLQPHRVPSQCAKLVEAEFGLSGQPSRLLWFKPDTMIRETMGLQMEESVVSRRDGNRIVVLVKNHTPDLVRLERNLIVRKVEPCCEQGLGVVLEGQDLVIN